MKQLVTYYRMAEDREEEIESLVYGAGFDGVENLIYGTKAAVRPFSRVTQGVHLKYWPYWMDFYLGNQEALAKNFKNREALSAFYGGDTPEEWISYIKGNIQAALAEKPHYLVWHVQENTVEESYTWRFHYSDREVLRHVAEVYRAVKHLIPDGVYVLFENLFWPGLFHMEPAKVEYFFNELGDPSHTGLLFDTGHYMVTNPDLQNEAEAAAFIEKMAGNLGELTSLIKGVHLSCSLSGDYVKHFKREAPKDCDWPMLMRHVCALDRHEPFQTDAAKRIVEALKPEYVTHELFGNTFAEALEKARGQRGLLR